MRAVIQATPVVYLTSPEFFWLLRLRCKKHRRSYHVGVCSLMKSLTLRVYFHRLCQFRSTVHRNGLFSVWLGFRQPAKRSSSHRWSKICHGFKTTIQSAQRLRSWMMYLWLYQLADCHFTKWFNSISDSLPFVILVSVLLTYIFVSLSLCEVGRKFGQS